MKLTPTAEFRPVRRWIEHLYIVESAAGYFHNDATTTYVKAQVDGTLDFTAEFFDTAVNIAVLHHIPNVSHVLRELFRVDPPTLRYADPERYAALGRVVTGEVMARAMGEWRRARSTCGGALVWLLRDLWTSCGWGVVGAKKRKHAPHAQMRYLIT